MAGERVRPRMPKYWLQRATWLALALWALLAAGCAAGASREAKSAAMPGADAMPGPPPPESAATAEFSEQDSLPGDAAGARPARMQAQGNALAAPEAPPPPPAAGGEASEPAQGQGTPVTTPGADGPLLIYRATLHMAVFETRDVMDAIEKLARKSGGYLVTRNDQLITIRVPAGRFEGVLDQIGKQGDELHREVSVSDVTEQFSDLSIRLKNAEAVRDRLAALLDKAQNVEEALAVEQQLARVAENIELLKGKLKLLRELVAFSTITVRFEARPVDKVGSKVELPFYWLKQLGLPELMSL